MRFLFSIGESVEYRPSGGVAGLYVVVRRMPQEDNASEPKYLIRNEQEKIERHVGESELTVPHTDQKYGTMRGVLHGR